MEVREGQSSGIVGRPLPTAEIYEELDQANAESQHTNRAYQSLLGRREPNTMLQTQPRREVTASAMSALGNCGGKASNVPLPDRDYLIPRSSDEEMVRLNSYSEPTNPGGRQCLLGRRDPNDPSTQPRREVRDASTSGNRAEKGSHGASPKYEQHIVSSEPFDKENQENDAHRGLGACKIPSPECTSDRSKQNPTPFDEENEDGCYHGLEAINALLPDNPSDQREINSLPFDQESQNNDFYHVLESSV